MSLNDIYTLKHELWLKLLYSSFAIENETIKNKLYEFSQIEFRHLKWLSNNLKEQNIEYNYQRSTIDIEKKSNFEYFEYLINSIKQAVKVYETTPIFARFVSDEFYMINILENYLKDIKNDASITAFNRSRKLKTKS